MEAKLTLKLNSGSIKRAKQYIRSHKGNSLSKLVERYFNSLTALDENKEEKKLPPIVASLAGVIKKSTIKDIKSEYTDYLIKKYQ
jgi:hypothetical protein